MKREVHDAEPPERGIDYQCHREREAGVTAGMRREWCDPAMLLVLRAPHPARLEDEVREHVFQCEQYKDPSQEGNACRHHVNPQLIGPRVRCPYRGSYYRKISARVRTACRLLAHLGPTEMSAV